MSRTAKPFPGCARAPVPRRTKAAILLRQNGRCVDCGTRLELHRIVFDHRPPLALREPGDDPNDPDRIAAICFRCDRLKTARDLTEIAKTKRLANEEAEHRSRMAEKVCGRPRLSRHAERELARWLGPPKPETPLTDDDPAPTEMLIRSPLRHPGR